MSKRRSRTRRRNIAELINNKATIIISLVVIVFLIIILGIMKLVNVQEQKKVAQEKQRIDEQVEEIYKDVNKEIDSLNKYKTNTIIRISAVGDILLGNNLKNYGKDYNDVFSDISKYLQDSDYTIGTYETNVTDENSKEFAKSVKKSGVNFVSLAHNHALDYGNSGLNNTNEYLKSIDMQTVGITGETPESRVNIQEIKGVKVAFLAYTYDNRKQGVNIFNEATAYEDLKYAKENAAVSIVMMHWGNVNTNEISSKQKEQAEYLVNNGADIIIGAHPSAVQKMEIIKNQEGKDCFVAYSLGDYTSDFGTENSNLELILNMQIFVDKEGNASIYKIDYTPVYMIDNGTKLKENRFKILDMKKEISDYQTDKSNINKNVYEKLVRGVDRLNSILSINK